MKRNPLGIALGALALAASCSRSPEASQGPSAADVEAARRLLADRRQPWWNGHALAAGSEGPKVKMAETGNWAAMDYNPPGFPILPTVVGRILQSGTGILKDSPFENHPIAFLDVRNASDFLVEHIPGSRNLPLRDLSKFPEDIDRKSIVIVTGELYPHYEVMSHVRKAGFSAVYCLEGGMRSWTALSYPVEGKNDVKEYRRLLETEREAGASGVPTDFIGLGPLALKSLLDGGVDMKLIFVGDEDTYKAGHIAGAIRATLNDLDTVSASIPKDMLVAVYCGCCAGRAGGYSEEAARKLRRMGYTRVLHLDGHLGAWREAGFPVVTASAK